MKLDHLRPRTSFPKRFHRLAAALTVSALALGLLGGTAALAEESQAAILSDAAAAQKTGWDYVEDAMGQMQDGLQSGLNWVRDNIGLALAMRVSPAEVTLVETDPEVTYHPAGADIAHSHPFNSMYCASGRETNLDANGTYPVVLEEYHYIEQEYFISGTANLYDLADRKDPSTLYIAEMGLPYTTRILVRYPDGTDGAPAFNGNVYVDLLNITAGYDNEDLWRRSYKYLMEGSAYVGITYNGTGAAALKNFDPERYAAINYPADENGKARNGISYDIINQVGQLIKSNKGAEILGGNKPEKVFLCAQSSSGYYLNGWLNVFYPHSKTAYWGRPVFDGYVSIVCGTLGVGTYNPDDYSVAFTSGQFVDTEEPFVAISSEMESSLKNFATWAYTPKADTDTFRLYEVAGAPHSDPVSPVVPNYEEINMANTKGDVKADKVYAEGHYESDLNLDQIITGALANIAQWARDPSFAMPSGQEQWIPVQGMAVERDAYGNLVGGVRMPQIEAPVATYYWSRNGAGYNTDGSMVYFTYEQLKARYGYGEQDVSADTLYARYLAEYEAAAAALKEAGLIRETECAELIAYSRNDTIKALFAETNV
ncbi:MAG: alpha/beta hydrolase domain-containing protein [Faecalibacterium sp.]